MREIKFRGKRINTNEWVESDCLMQFGNINTQLWQIGEGWIDIDTETIGQYIGIKDKNGKEIYEGDIIKDSNDSGVVKFATEEVGSCGCCYDSFVGTGFIAEAKNSKWLELAKYCEVVGNIYDNPELLKE